MNRPTTPPLSFPETLLVNLKPGLFAVPLGILALSACWARFAGFAGMSYSWAERLSALILDAGLLGLAVLLVLLLLKLMLMPGRVWQEALHPGLGASFALIPVSCLLALTALITQYPQLNALWHMIMLFALALQGLIT